MPKIWVATAGGLYEATTGEPVALEGDAVDAISLDGNWAIGSGHEVWAQSSDGWKVAATADRSDLTCVLPVEDGALVGTEEAHLLKVTSGGPLEKIEAFEKVEGRDQWFTPWGGPPAVRSMARTESEIYVNVHVGGIVKGDGDSQWEPTLDISADVHEVRVVGDLIVAACAVGLAESGDGGYAWSFDDEGLHATYARAIAAGGQFLFMSVSNGPRGGDAAIYRQPCDGDKSFERCDLPSFDDNIDTGCLDAVEDLVAFVTPQGEVFVSADEGVTWDRIESGLPPSYALVIER